ncbi:MAG: hypothetical protein RLZZ165_1970 [Bacteroidota bacterium]
MFLPRFGHHILIMKSRLILWLAAISFVGCQSPSSSSEIPSSDSTAKDSSHIATGDTSAVDCSMVRTNTSDPDSARRQSIEGAFNVPEAMEVIYGLYDRNIECSKWVCKPHEAKRFESKATGKGTLHTRAAGTYPIETAEGKKIILLTETLSREKDDWEDCHACAPILGAAMFQQIDDDWFIEALQKDLGEFGSWGRLPERHLAKIGPDMYGVLFRDRWTGQGISIGAIEIIGIVNEKFHVLLNENISYSNRDGFAEPDAEPRAFSYDSRIQFEERGSGEPYDLLIITQGTSPVDGPEGSGPIVDVSKTKRFRIKGDKYSLVR